VRRARRPLQQETCLQNERAAYFVPPEKERRRKQPIPFGKDTPGLFTKNMFGGFLRSSSPLYQIFSKIVTRAQQVPGTRLFLSASSS
jgi:hypothetical protein